jgi:hypothetical protein
VEEMLRASLGPKRFVREKAEQPLTKQQKEIQSMFEKKMLESYSNFEI